MPKEKKRATTKGKVKGSRVKKHKDRDSRRKTKKTGDCDCPKSSGEKQEKIKCYICGKEQDFSQAVKYNEHLWFYWCSCSQSALVIRRDKQPKAP